MFWIKIDKFGEMHAKAPFLLRDASGYVYEGFTAFDYYDAEYWFPMPSIPMETTITNDAWVSLALSKDG